MGTRSTISFVQKTDDEMITYVTVYQQYDGYIDGVGHALAEWLLSKRMIDGIGFDQYTKECVNGIGCMVAQFIRDFKTEVGGLYIYPSVDKDYIDYNYTVIIENGIHDIPKNGIPLNDITTIEVRNFDIDEPIFIGSPSELLKFKEG